MKAAIDVDGTIGRYPALFGALMAALKHLGHTVVILTGNAHYDGAAGRAIFAGIGLWPGVHYDAVVVVPGANLDELGRAKAALLKAQTFDLFIDDYQPYCDEARSQNPQLLILRVQP